ncbi:MAG: hypothetical protein LWW93_05495 [Hyphomicrobiales bacterium]|nr:hypothetical protein [Hyphomicrobiales bacterium]
MRGSFLLAAGLTAGLLAAPAFAAEPLSEKAALAKAVAILQGDPYGDTPSEVARNIVDRKLGPRRESICGGGASQVWSFHVHIDRPKTNPEGAIDGWLVIDGASGRLICAGLPFLD